ncbi:DUF4328 domain-containing protein [Corallococcus sp. AB050B]|nr:DUF4328 domain-containing protein [Corallococcus sp. AB050B]
MVDAVEGDVASRPMCPQHPEREAVLTCARCGRYACSGCVAGEGRCRECLRLSALEVPDSRARARRATVLQYAQVGTSLVGVLFGLLVRPEIEGQARLQYVAENSFLFLVFVVTLAEKISFLMWVHRVVRQLEGLGMDIGRSPAGAVWMWLIPFISWWKPYGVMRDIAERLGGMRFVASLPLQWWWTSHILALLLDRVESGLTSRPSAAVDNTAGTVMGVLASVSAAAMSLLCVQIIKDIQVRLDRRREGLDEEEAPAAGDVAEAA